MSLTSEEIKKYETRLVAEKEKLNKDIAEHEKTVDFGDDVESEDEEADEAEETGNQLAIGRALRDRLVEIEDALANIKAGTYGICKSCGKEITKEVLNIVPESRFCKNCKQKGQR